MEMNGARGRTTASASSTLVDPTFLRCCTAVHLTTFTWPLGDAGDDVKIFANGDIAGVVEFSVNGVIAGAE